MVIKNFVVKDSLAGFFKLQSYVVSLMNNYFVVQQKELMDAGRKQLEQLVQMNFLQQAHATHHPELNKSLLEQLQMSQENFNSVLLSQNVSRQLFKQGSPTHVHLFQQYLMILVLQLKYMKGQKHSKRVK